MTLLNIREDSVINASNVVFVPTIDSEISYKYVGKILAQKPVNFTGVGVVIHVYTYEHEYLFTTVGFVNGFKFRYLRFQGIDISNASLLNPIISGALTNILDKRNKQYSELREKIISYFRLNQFLSPDPEYLCAYFDYYVYRNDRIIGLYRLVEQDQYTISSEPDLNNDGMYESQFMLDFKTNNKLTFKLFDSTNEPKAFGYEHLQVSDTTLHVKMNAVDNRLTLSSYFELENFKLSSAKSSLLKLIVNEASKPIVCCKVRLYHNRYDADTIGKDVEGLRRGSVPLSNDPELVLPFIFGALSSDSDIIDVGGAFARAYSTIYDRHHRLVPLAKSDLLDIDGGLAISQYDDYIERYKQYGLGLYGKIYLSDQCIIVGVNASNKVRKIHGYYFMSGFTNSDIFMYDRHAKMYLVKPFSGYLVSLETRNPGLETVVISDNDVAVALTDIVRSKTRCDTRFNVHVLNYNMFYIGRTELVMTKVPEPFQIKQVYLAYVETSYMYYVPFHSSFDSRFEEFIWSLYVTCPHALHMLPDFKFDNFTTIPEDERENVLSGGNILMSYVISSNAFDVSDSYAPITVNRSDYSSRNSLLKLYNAKYSNDNSKFGMTKHIPAIEIKHLIVDNSMVFERLVKTNS